MKEKVNNLARSYEHLKTNSEYFRFLKYVTVKMIKGSEIKNRWIDYAELTDDSSYSRHLEDLLTRAINQKILIRHKNLIRFRLNSIFQAFMTIS